MHRRDILKISTAVLAYSMSGAATAAVLSGCQVDMIESWKPAVLNGQEVLLISEIAERIIPATDSPGAKDAKVERYIDMALQNNYTLEERKRFIDALPVFNQNAKNNFNLDFVDCSDEEKDQILENLVQNKAEIFFEIKSLTVSGFFTSKEGATMVLKYDPIPGELTSCMDLSEIGGRWAY